MADKTVYPLVEEHGNPVIVECAVRDGNGKVIDTEYVSKTATGAQTIVGPVTFSGDVGVQNLHVFGTATIINSTDVTIADNLIIIAKDNAASLVNPAGVIVPKYDGTHYGGTFLDSTGTMYVGDVGLTSDGKNIDPSSADTTALPVLLKKKARFDDDDLLVWNNTDECADDSGISKTNVAYAITAVDNAKAVVVDHVVSGNTDLITAGVVADYVAAHAYVLPAATATVMGGVKISNTASAVSDNAITTTAGRNYQVQKSSADGTLCVNVPWSDTNTTYSDASATVTGLVNTTEQWFGGMKGTTSFFATADTGPASWVKGTGYGANSIKLFYPNANLSSHYSTQLNYPMDATDANPNTTHTIAVDIKLGSPITMSW